MKIPAAFATLLVAAASGLAQSPAPAPKTNMPAPAPAASTKKAPAPAPAKKKEEPPGKIEGMEIARGDKGFLGLQIVNGTFKLSFYDTKKKPIAPDVTRAALRWDPRNRVGQERAVLTADGSNALTSAKNIRPPYSFKLFITLLKDAGGENADAPAGETLVVDFRQ